MNHKLSFYICQNMIKKGTIKEELAQVYTYGIELLLSFIFSVSVMLIIGAVVHRIIDTLIFLVLFILIRKMTGGFHASTYFRCQIITLGTYGLVLFLSNCYHPNFIFHIFLFVFGGAFIWIFGPIENKGKPLSDANKKKNKILGVITFCFVSGSSALLSIWKPLLVDTVYFTLLSIIILMIIPIAERRIHNA